MNIDKQVTRIIEKHSEALIKLGEDMTIEDKLARLRAEYKTATPSRRATIMLQVGVLKSGQKAPKYLPKMRDFRKPNAVELHEEAVKENLF